jgi:hypothetical protein
VGDLVILKLVPGLAYDVAFERMTLLAKDMVSTKPQRNEAETRLQLIDRLLFDCLGWSRELAGLEGPQDLEYADYVLDKKARRLIVEAKREGTTFELPLGLERVAKLTALHALGGAVDAALKQVQTYAQRRGTPYAAICNGHQLVAFIASRADGVPPRDGKALVFASPEELVDGFQMLWETLTEDGCATRRLTKRLRGVVAAPPPKLAEQIRDYTETAPTTERDAIFSALHVLFLPEYERDTEREDDFLRECYCPPGAFSQLALLNRGVLRTRFSTALGAALQVGLEDARTKEGLNPHLVEEVASTSAGREPLVLLGSLGVGKTMFLRRLLRIDAKDLAEQAVVLYVDLGRSAVLEDLKSYVALSLKDQLINRYGVDIGADDFMHGTYHKEVRAFAGGVNAPLKDLDPSEFKKREIDLLVELASHPETHLGRSLQHLVKLRKEQVIIVLDNIDQRDRADQEQTFLVAQTMAQNWPCTVFVTLRPETFNASRIRGTLSGYQPRAFVIDPPRVERMITQRFRYGERHYKHEDRLPQWMGWTAQSDDLRVYFDALSKSFARNESLREGIVNLSGGNARRALDLMTDFLQSPHSQADEIIKRHKQRGRDYIVPWHTFLRAILLCDGLYYDPKRSSIPNLFDISTSDEREHFVLPCLLGLLRRATERPDSEGYSPIEDVFAAFQDAGFETEQVDFALSRARDGNLVDQLPPEGEIRSVRLTTAGAYAHQYLASEFEYVDAIVVDTPVGNPTVRGQLTSVRAIRLRLERAEVFLGYLDSAWEASRLSELGVFDWAACASAVRSRIAVVRSHL